MMEGCSDSDDYSLYGQPNQELSNRGLVNTSTGDTNVLSVSDLSSGDSIVLARSPLTRGEASEIGELEFLNSCREAGVVHIMGNTSVRANRNSALYKKIAVDYIYAFFRKICRENSDIFNVPHESLLNVGQVIYV
nr:potassium transporter 11 transcript variant 2 [Fagopyrum tataricum]